MGGFRSRWIVPALGWILAVAAGSSAHAGTFPLFEPVDFVRSAGKPVNVVRDFPTATPGNDYALHIANGGSRQQFLRVASAVVKLNGTVIAGPSDFNPNVRTIDKPVKLTAQNRLEVELHGGPGSGFTLTVLGRDDVAPEITIVEPSVSVLEDVTTTQIRISFSDATSGIDPGTLSIELDGNDLTATCTVGSDAAQCVSPELSAGLHSVTAQVRDRAENPAFAGVDFTVVFDEEAPSLAITAPNSPLLTGDSSPEIRLAYSDTGRGVDPSSLRVEVDGNDVTGLCQTGPASAVCEPPELARGLHRIDARIADLRGNVASASFEVALAFPLEIAFTEPEPDFLTGVASVRVAGTVSPSARSVRVNGVAAQLGSGTFSIESLGLHDGVNELVAVAEDAAGNVGTASVRVIADTTPPGASITFPVDGSVVSTPTVTVTGLINDLTIGTVSDTRATVTVNGVAASVANRSFAATGVPLLPGANTVIAVATDRAGNRATAEIHVTHAAPAGVASLRIVSGDWQTATISSVLPAPLVVAVRDAAGQPVRDAQVVFRVVRGDGTLEGGQRIALVRTNAQGQASLHWTIGSRAGVGVDRVRATAVGVVGEISFSATALAGAPAAINVASGDDQRGAVGTGLSRPLFAVVTDDGHNAIPGVPITFRVVAGDGGLVEGAGADTAVVETDDSGLASVRLILGPSQGFDNNLVEATHAGLTTLPATFKASAFLAGDPAQTKISGTVLDNQGDPVPGVTMRIRDTALTATTDAQGRFLVTGVPVGQVFLIADATTAARPGHWASLEYELFAIAGVENTLPRPIYILPLDLPNGVYVDETRGGTVTLPEVPGFSLEIAPGSVTFPSGTRSGVVSVTAVHADRVPMAPGAGMQPRLIVTIQPGGAHFDPPAKLTLPNVDGLAPGTVTELFSFDHDIGEFVAIGTGTVSEDGLVVQSDPGFGILEAGWHCGAPPSGSGASATLSVTVSSGPLFLVVGKTPADKGILKASGQPALDSVYSWTIADPSIATLNRTGSNLCPNAGECTTEVTAVAPGETTATATVRCTTTGNTTKIQTKVYVVSVDDVNVYGSDLAMAEARSSASALDEKDVGADPSTAKVRSVKEKSPLLHFVTAINQGQVILIASTTPATKEVRDRITWETPKETGIILTSPASPEVGDDKGTVKFSSDLRRGRKIPITMMFDGKAVKDIVAWVVSADMAGRLANGSETSSTVDGRRTGQGKWTLLTVTATIQPPEIITDPDRPDLRGPHKGDHDIDGFYCGAALSWGVDAKWDLSRRIATRATTVRDENQPEITLSCEEKPINFSREVRGNGDVGTENEDNDPYTVSNRFTTPDQVGELLSPRMVSSFGPNEGRLTNGHVTNKYDIRFWFEEFARLELPVASGPRWFLISDSQRPLQWRVHYSFVKQPVTEEFWGRDYDGDGFVTSAVVTERMLGEDTNGDGDMVDNVGYWSWIQAISAQNNDEIPK